MAVENPPLNRLYVLGYAANDRNYPLVSMNLDPRVAGYKVPEDLSTCPDKRYPNHVFTGAQPLSGDERVRHVWEILPSPWVPFTRYDDDLGPIQGRRRSVENTGQQASLASDTKISYEGREGSAIVSTELEETWSIKTDEDGNSLFPIKDRDFYDASRGPVQERRQLFVPTGEEVGSLENVNGVITQTSYEPYNEFLSVKIVQTYKVDGPALVGKATDNDGQLVTVTTQRKGALNYISPNPTATRTVEVNREDAESLVERIIDTPEIFKANTFSVERPDPIPQKFRVAVPIQSSQEIVEGTAVTPTLEEGEISKSEEQRNKFIKRVSSTSRDQAVLPQTLTGKTTNNERQEVIVTETLQLGNTNEAPTATTTIESEALGDGNYVITKTEIDQVFGAETYRKTKDDLTPQKFRGAQEESTTEENIEGVASNNIALASGEFAKSEQQINSFVKRVSTTSRTIDITTTLSESVLTPEGLRATRTLTLSNGPQSFAPSATLVDANVEALGDGRTVKTETTIAKIFAGKTLSVEKPDVTPQKFQASVQSVTKQENIEGAAAQPVLSGGEIAKSEQQVTEFVKRVSTTSRNDNGLPVSLSQKATTQDKQLATITETLQRGDTQEQPTSRIDIQSEAIGDGKYVVTKTQVPEVFKAQTFRSEKSDLTPQKFRAKQVDQTKEETIEGEAEIPSLSENEFSKTEQQINKFVKRVTTTERETELTETLNESVITPDGQLGNRIITLSKAQQTLSPSATTIDGNVEELGDGRTVKTEISVDSVFDGKQESLEKPEVIPPEFRASLQNRTITEVKAGQSITLPSLSQNEISKTIQRLTEHKIRETTVTRPSESYPQLSGELIDNDSIKVTRKRTVAKGDQTISPSAKVSGTVEALGDGYTLKTEDTKEKIFEAKTFSEERPDNIPVEFRVEKPATTKEFNQEGEAEEVSLLDTEIAKSEQQVNGFIKRVRTTTRDDVGAVKLSEEQVDQDGVKVTVERQLSKGSQQITPSETVRGQVQNLGGGYTVKTTLTRDEVLELPSFSVEKPDVVPAAFRSQVKTTTEEKTITGDAEEPTLNNEEISKTERQIDKFLKRTTTVSRPETVSGQLVGEQIESDGIKSTITRKLSDGPQDITPSAKVSGNVEDIGDGLTIKTEIVKDEVFDSKQKTFTQATQVPAKFLNEKITETSFIEEGTTEEPENVDTDGFGVVQSSSQRISAFLRRQTKREQQGTKSLGEQQTNNFKQRVTVTSSIIDNNENITPSATTEFLRVESIGGGKYLKEEGAVESLFDSASKTAQKPETIPEKFRINSPIRREEETVESNELAEELILGDEEFLKTEQRLTEFTVQKTTVTRKDEFNDVLSQRLEENWGIQIPYKEYISGEVPSGENYEVEGLDDKNYLVREYNLQNIEEILSSFNVTIPTSIDLDLPLVLKNVTINWQEEKSTSISETDTTGALGQTRSLSQQDGGRVSSTLSLVPQVETEFENIWGKNIPAKIHLFFLRKEDLNDSEILSKIDANGNWPVFRLQSYSKTIFGKSQTKELQATISRAYEINNTPSGFFFSPSQSSQESTSTRIIPVSINIPPCLRSEISIEEEKLLESDDLEIELNYEGITATLDNGGSQEFPPVDLKKTLKHLIAFSFVFTIPPTPDYQDIPRAGTYLISSSAEPYKFGWFLVRAVSFDASRL